MKRILAAILAVLLVVCLSCGAFAAIKTVKPNDDFYYLDDANVLSRETEGEIYFCNSQLYDACGAQICIVAMKTINGASTEEYAYELANSWGIGSSDKNNGFLLLMAIKEDDYYAIAGSGLQKIFPASVIKDYYDLYLEDDFAAKNYDAGARKFFEAVFNKVVDFYNLDLTVEDGIAAFKSFEAGSANASARTYGGAKGAGGAGPSSRYASSNDYDDDIGWSSSATLGLIIFIIILFFVIRPFRFIGGGRRYYGNSYYNRPSYGPGPHGPHGGPRGGFGSSFGSSYSSRSSFGSGAGRSSFGSSSRSSFGSSSSSRSSSSSSSSSFGGGRSGGGGGFGGGAGRGRH